MKSHFDMPKRADSLPVCKEMCATCPFRPGSKYAYLQDGLTDSALKDKSRICHSTGSNNAINKRTGKPSMLCRGARDIQLTVFHALGVIDAPTDEAWSRAWENMRRVQ
jgi:hypothetical protein